jgi:molybdate transport system ATP-binding protein
MSLSARVALRRGEFTLDVALEAGRDEVVAVLGPNAAGKSTFLAALAGLIPLERGRVALDARVLEDTELAIHLPAEERPVGVVFQDSLLFPHLSVLDNVGFGLRCRGRSRADARRAAAAWLERLSAGDLATLRPSQLSGGQAQRVALARALAVQPALLLLDEPLSALDVSARPELRRLLRAQLAEFAGVKLLVTHDPIEALALAERLVVIERGRVVQAGSAAEVAGQPRSAYVADLVGVNLLRGRAAGDRIALDGGGELTAAGAGTGEVFAVIHPRAVALYRQPPDGTPRNLWRGVVGGLDPEGDRVRVRVDAMPPIVAEITAAAAAEIGLASGSPIWVSIKATEIRVYPR